MPVFIGLLFLLAFAATAKPRAASVAPPIPVLPKQRWSITYRVENKPGNDVAVNQVKVAVLAALGIANQATVNSISLLANMAGEKSALLVLDLTYGVKASIPRTQHMEVVTPTGTAYMSFVDATLMGTPAQTAIAAPGSVYQIAVGERWRIAFGYSGEVSPVELSNQLASTMAQAMTVHSVSFTPGAFVVDTTYKQPAMVTIGSTIKLPSIAHPGQSIPVVVKSATRVS